MPRVVYAASEMFSEIFNKQAYRNTTN